MGIFAQSLGNRNSFSRANARNLLGYHNRYPYRGLRRKESPRIAAQIRLWYKFNMAKRLAKILKQHRTRLQWSLRDAGNEAGVDFSVVHRIENGEVKSPGVDTIDRLARAYGTTLLALLKRAGYK